MKIDLIKISKRVKFGCFAGLSLLSILGFYCFIYCGYEDKLTDSIYMGELKINGVWNYDKEKAFGKEEALACRWIKENTPSESIIISDGNNRKYSKQYDGYYSYYVGIFSERQQYIEALDLLNVIELENNNKDIMRESERRSNIVLNMYNGSKNALNLLKNEGVDYIMCNKECSPDFQLLEDGKRELVYDKNQIEIYKANTL